MLRSNLCQLLCNGFCGFFFSTFACQESSLLERMSRALAACGGRELAWCFTCPVLVSPVLVSPAATSQPPLVASVPVETPGSFPTSCAGLGPCPATRSRSGTACFNSSHSYSLRQRLACLCLPSFPTLRKGETLYTARDDTWEGEIQSELAENYHSG